MNSYLPIFSAPHTRGWAFPDTSGVVTPSGIADPEVENVVVWAAVHEGSEPWVVFVALVSVADVAEPHASVDIALASDVSVPVSVGMFEVYNSECPRFVAIPNVDYFASSSSSFEVVS